MRKPIPVVFPTFTQKFEGNIPWMYLDKKGLVTIGLGNLIDPMRVALTIHMVHISDINRVATADEIVFEWRTMKLNTFLANAGAQAAKRFAKLQITVPTLAALVSHQLSENETILKHAFPKWDSWPTDAQMGVMSMAWAMGPGFTPHFPRFSMACSIQDWKTAADNCYINSKNNAGLVPRNHADKALFLSAERVVDGGLDFDTLYGWSPTDPVRLPANPALRTEFHQYRASRGLPAIKETFL